MRLPPTTDPSTAEGRLDCLIRAAVALELLPYDEETRRKLFSVQLALLERDRKAVPGGQNSSIIATTATEALDKVAADARQRLGPRPARRAAEGPAGPSYAAG
jgi:hypothetical protein